MLKKFSTKTGKANFSSQLETGEFIVTAEYRPPATASAEYLLDKAVPIAGRVDAINITDGAGAQVHTSSLAVSALLVREGYEPILQVTCRDRNRIALEAHLLGASALGIRNILCMRGDDPTAGDYPDAKGVFDLDSLELIKMAANLRDEGTLMGGRKVEHPPSYVIGTVDTPVIPSGGQSFERLLAKVDGGAAFVQTQFCYDPGVAEAYIKGLRVAGFPRHIRLLIGIGPINSVKSALWMRDHLHGVEIPDEIIKRLDSAKNPIEEGRQICVELMHKYRNLDGIDGVHLMAVRDETEIVRVIDEACAM